MAPDVLLTVYAALGLLGVLGGWFYYDGRDARRAAKRRREAAVFACVRCTRVYVGPKTEETRPCPACGFANGRLRF